MRHFLDLLGVSADDLRHLLAESVRLKAAHARGIPERSLAGKVVALVFEKPSLRTRVSFEAGVAHLGGTSLFFPGNEIGLGWRETHADFVRTMSRFVDCLVLRVFKHETVEKMVEFGSVPVINALSDRSHPCQALADLLTIQELFGSVEGRTVAFIGDGNNVARSLAIGCAKLGARFVLGCPVGYEFDDLFAHEYKTATGKLPPETVHDPVAAVRAADVIYTDVWTSMGQEAEREERLQRFAPFQVNAALMEEAPAHCKVLHCLPAHRGEEITDDVIDGPQSAVFDQAENRMHAQKAILEWLFEPQAARR
ncbi:ornithine carbamoyltransferase [Fimbriiglobus ruber]|uniref:Ornithine carbamoyltransferase n=1 Tax=Fimbriiglobus ruber TaxID=1908690 RepID=A0A225DHE9_9BACT|nr:ornithine carbamoyltransferase [Fimbriiglobus ruber]OWK36619.1 Ornithine carbamoyltransferase [Fimbriiglobus ruber]